MFQKDSNVNESSYFPTRIVFKDHESQYFQGSLIHGKYDGLQYVEASDRSGEVILPVALKRSLNWAVAQHDEFAVLHLGILLLPYQ